MTCPHSYVAQATYSFIVYVLLFGPIYQQITIRQGTRSVSLVAEHLMLLPHLPSNVV